jgi:hypothetical protein
MAQDSQMNFEENLYEQILIHFARMYLLLGVIERRLRREIPNTLRNHTQALDGQPWWFLLTHNEIQRVRVIRALAKNRGEIDNFERFLAFVFWRDIFKGKCFRNLWLPALHKAFPGLENPLDSRSYGKTKFHIDKAYEIRNRIAHFDETDTADYEKEELLLLWLVDALGGFSSEC